MMAEMSVKKEITQTYPYLRSRRGVWKEIVRYIHKDIGFLECLVELGSGYGDFINQYPAARKICYDINPAMSRFTQNDVEFRCENGVTLPGLSPDSVDAVFASNFLEHLTTQEFDVLMPRILTVLRREGKLVLIQPNYNLCKESYFNDKTHQTIFSDENIQHFLKKYGFTVEILIPGLLPFSMKSRLPKWPFLVRLYLLSSFRPGAAQMYVVAEKR